MRVSSWNLGSAANQLIDLHLIRLTQMHDSTVCLHVVSCLALVVTNAVSGDLAQHGQDFA